MVQSARKLKLDDASIARIIERLDEQEMLAAEDTPALVERFPYRVRALQLDVHQARDEITCYAVPTRNIGRDGVSVLIGNLIHVGSRVTVHLITIRNNWQTVSGDVASCKYIQGSACAHIIDIQFDRPIDPASFAPTAARARVLLADDSPMARRLISHLLEMSNSDVTCVENGIDAVARAQDESFDVVLMDVEMPLLDGIEAVKLLRSKGYVRAIVAVSALSDPDVRERALLAGCDDFLPKPIDREMLKTVINRIKPEPLVSALLHYADMQPLIDEFVDLLPDRVRELEAAFAAQDFDLLNIELRKLKGEGAGFGFEPITHAACNLEIATRNNLPLSELRVRLRDLIHVCLSARPATCDRMLEVVEPEDDEELLSEVDDDEKDAEEQTQESSELGRPAAA